MESETSAQRRFGSTAMELYNPKMDKRRANEGKNSYVTITVVL
jgi:hypothetical protein